MHSHLPAMRCLMRHVPFLFVPLLHIILRCFSAAGWYFILRLNMKAGEGEDWRDMTPYMEQKENQYYGALQITENCTVYVRVDASDGKLYEKSRYIDFFKGGSDALYQVNPVPEDAPVASRNPAQTDSAGESKPLTPDGQGTVVDDVTGDGKEFYTITTPAENIFYLVIDKQRDKENVYFLNAVTEADLMALAEPDAKPSGTGTGTVNSGGSSWLSELTPHRHRSLPRNRRPRQTAKAAPTRAAF